MKTIFSLLAILSFAAPVLAQTSAAEASAPQPRTALQVSAPGSDGRHVVSAVVTEAATGRAIARQKMILKAGNPATLESGGQNGQVLRLAVEIDAKGKVASYRTEFLRDGRVLASESGRVPVDGGA